jgi:alpha-glucoside transport system permease protein
VGAAPLAEVRGGRRLRRWVAAGAFTAAAALLLAPGFSALRDEDGVERLVVSVLRLVGLGGSADAIADRGLTPITSKLLTLAVAVVVGIGGIWLLLAAMNAVAQAVGGRIGDRLRPLVFVGPAMLLVGVFLLYPMVRTIVTSLTEDGGVVENYGFAFTDDSMLIAFRNNLLWLVIGTGGSVVLGLSIAALVDRVRHEALAKTFVFLPLAISLVGASVIWRFVYTWRPPGEPQIGALNAIVTGLGREPIAWLQQPPLNTIALITIIVWLQTGFAMVVFSAAIKGVPTEQLEAARLDGAGELRLFFDIVLPSIRGTLIAVVTTICIVILKVFDVVYVMTGGNFETEVIANRMFTELFRFGNAGHSAALAVVLFVLVIPFIVINLRSLRGRRVA